MPSPRLSKEWAAAIATKAHELALAAAITEELCLQDHPSIVVIRAQGRLVRRNEIALDSVLYNRP